MSAEHVSEDVIVSFADGYSAADLTAALRESGCTLPQDITAHDVETGYVVLKVSDDYDVEHAMTQLGLLPELDGAQPNFIYHLADDGFGGRQHTPNIRRQLKQGKRKLPPVRRTTHGSFSCGHTLFCFRSSALRDSSPR